LADGHGSSYFLIGKKIQPQGISGKFAATAAPTKRVAAPCRSGDSREFGLHNTSLDVMAEEHCQSGHIFA